MENKGFTDIEDGVDGVQKLTLLRGRWRAAIACLGAAACCWLATAGCGLLQLAGDDRGMVAATARCSTGGKEGVWQGPIAASLGGGRG